MLTGSPRIYFSDEEYLRNNARSACVSTSTPSTTSKPEEPRRVKESGMIDFL